jgi:squalene-hopene/tetraprenyl-beta-curcumene cyclase
MAMLSRAAVCLALSLLPATGADWNPRLAAQYLDSRQKEWFVWPRANAAAKPCVSCHTGVTYLLARPMLREALGEAAPTIYETGLLASLRSRLDQKEPAASPGLGVESIFAARFLGTADALDRMWALQVHEGAAKGAWNWFSLDRDPWEMPDSRFYGAALAAMAVPAKDHGRPAALELVAYLNREQAAQPLHNRLMLLWASAGFPEALPAAARNAIVEEVWKKQQADGSWTMDALGPFQAHANAPRADGGNAYATAFTAYVMQQAAGDGANPKLARALGWLRTHQDPECGCWQAPSMNERYELGTMPAKFMADAATSFAVLALLGSRNSASAALPPAY